VKIWQPVPPDPMGYAPPPLDAAAAAAIAAASVAAAPLTAPSREPIA
jgi:hypothetical protein